MSAVLSRSHFYTVHFGTECCSLRCGISLGDPHNRSATWSFCLRVGCVVTTGRATPPVATDQYWPLSSCLTEAGEWLESPVSVKDLRCGRCRSQGSAIGRPINHWWLSPGLCAAHGWLPLPSPNQLPSLCKSSKRCLLLHSNCHLLSPVCVIRTSTTSKPWLLLLLSISKKTNPGIFSTVSAVLHLLSRSATTLIAFISLAGD